MYQNLQVQQPNSKYKTQLCRHFVTIGSCALGARCQFAHGRQELRTNNQVVTNYTQTNIQQNHQGDTQNRVQHINPMIANYKTQLCKHFNPQIGQCKNGSTCTFAHGEQELNQINPYLQNQYMQMQQQIKQQSQVTLQAELTQQILIMILTNMEAIFPGQNNIINLLKLGQEKARQGDNQTASEIIKQIIHDEQRTKEEKLIPINLQQCSKSLQSKIKRMQHVSIPDLIFSQYFQNIFKQNHQIIVSKIKLLLIEFSYMS